MTELPSNPTKTSERSSGRTAREHKPGAGLPAGDGAFVDRVRGGDLEAMTYLFDRYGSMVYSVALRILRDPGHAEDVMQDVFFKVWKEPAARLKGAESLGPWLAVVTRNRAIDNLRRRRPTDPADDVALPSGTNLAAEVEQNTAMDKVRGLLRSMPPDQRNSLDMAFFEGLSHSEIAAKTGVPLGTVKTRIRSALIFLRKALER
jgi:RNA polymerase sigma-70 factor (ECF subfamily)